MRRAFVRAQGRLTRASQCVSVQTMIMFSIIVNLSSLFVYLFLFSFSPLIVFVWQPGSSDSR